MRRMKRAVCLLLCFVMVVGLLPMTAFAADNEVSGSGSLVGGKVYTLNADGVIDTSKTYLIVNTNSGSGYALTNNNGSAGHTSVTISNNTISVADDTNIAWTFSGSESGTVGNNGRYVYPNNGSLSLNEDDSNMTISSQGNGAYRIYRSSSNYYYYLTYSSYFGSGSWTGARTRQQNSIASVYLYELTSSSSGEAVTFTVAPGSATIAPNGTVALNGTVTVAGTEVDLDDCAITWASDKTGVATVSGGTVTAVADGTADITATLTAVNGTSLVDPIELMIPVTVESKKVTGYELTGNTPVVVKVNGTPAFPAMTLTLTYEGGETKVITDLEVTGYDVTQLGSQIAEVRYNGVKYGTIVVTVVPDYDYDDPATKYPQYPNDGAVRIDKLATSNAAEFNRTGVTRVELSVAGVSVIQGVDVVMVADISNSMAWRAGYKNTSPGTGQTTKWQDLQTAAGGFIDILLEESEDGSINNTVSFVTFGGYDAERNNNSSSYSGYFDATQTLFTSLKDAASAKSQINAYSITGTDSAGYKVTKNGTDVGTPQGGTNYDYAFLEAASAIEQIKADYAAANEGKNYDESGREIYIVFMTDGAPDHYNQLYYKTRNDGQFDYYALYRNEGDKDFLENNYFDVEGHELPGNGFTRPQEDGYYIGNVSNADWLSWLQSDSLYVAEQVMAIPRVRSISTVGFDLENGAFSTYSFSMEDLVNLLSDLAGENSCDVFATADSTELKEFYEGLAADIKYAGTQATVTDKIHTDYSLQTTQTVYSYVNAAGETVNIDMTKAPSIQVITYDLYPRGTTRVEVTDGEETVVDITGVRIPGTAQNVETVTFSADGTEAYSDKIGDSVNIMTYVSENEFTIAAKTFTYTKNASGETFSWTIGNVTDKEIALSYDAYLEGSLEGNRSEGVYDTNEFAYLEYVDIDGKYAKQTFPVPAEVWGGASTTIRFYLVNEKGEPVNNQGQVVSWGNRIFVGEPVVVPLNLNADATIEAQKVEAAAYVPAQYFLYDVNAYYTVKTTSSADGIEPGIQVSAPSTDAFKTTGSGQEAKTQTGAQTTRVIDYEDPHYTWSYVGFGVRWDLTSEEASHPLAKDETVYDYGKAIQIDVLANDTDAISHADETGYEHALSGFVVYSDPTAPNYIQRNPGSATLTTKSGVLSIVDGKVQYQPKSMVAEVEKVFYVVQFVRYDENGAAVDTYYLFGELNVIPATSVYYETDFAENVFTTVGTWTTVSDPAAGDVADEVQNDGTIGVDQTYGFDTTYLDDDYFSNGDSQLVHGLGYDSTYTTFSFKGTGIDLFSRTGAEQGLIKMEIYSDAAMTNNVKTVSVLNKSDSNLELYQIPVISVDSLDYGTYYVKIGVNVGFNREGFENLYRGDEFHFDAVRIFDPAFENEVAEDAYYRDGEAYGELFEVRQLLLAAGDSDVTTEAKEGVSFVDLNQNAATIVEYEKIGPNNEVYIAENEGIVFRIDWDGPAPSSIDIGAKSINGAPAHLKAFISGDDTKPASAVVDTTIGSATAEFYELVNADNSADFSNGNSAYVFIQNDGSETGVLSITDIKVAFGDLASGAAAVSFMADARALNFAVACMSLDEGETDVTEPTEPEATEPEATEPEATEPEVTEPEVTEPETTEPEATEPEATQPVYDIIRVSANTKGSIFNRKTTFTVVTTQDVANLKIAQMYWFVNSASMTYADQDNGTRVWTVEMPSVAIGTYTITAYGADGTRGDSASVVSWGI